MCKPAATGCFAVELVLDRYQASHGSGVARRLLRYQPALRTNLVATRGLPGCTYNLTFANSHVDQVHRYQYTVQAIADMVRRVSEFTRLLALHALHANSGPVWMAASSWWVLRFTDDVAGRPGGYHDLGRAIRPPADSRHEALADNGRQDVG